MMEQLLLLIRISKPEYNKTLYDDYTLFMNPQMEFKRNNLCSGQQDIMEGAITNIPSKILFSMDDKKTWKPLGEPTLIHKNNHAYIYCMYGIKYDVNCYNAKENKYRYVIPWDYIKPLWQGDNTELMIINNTSVFFDKFHQAATDRKLSHSFGKIHYDLDEKLSDVEYFGSAIYDRFEAVYHKVREKYEIQNEIRLSVICPDQPEYYKLKLLDDQKLKFTLIPLQEGKSILVELSDLEFDISNIPIRFSSEIHYYESN